ncbi:MAG: ribosomal protein S18-alanine N-acetyltransferase [bacterium]|nr:ribosomal protein S18-alanine N-acetyltransferase [bacterium]
MALNIKLRKFRISDLDRILRIEKSSFSSVDAYSKRRFQCLYRKHPQDFIVAEKVNEIVGYIIAYGKKGFVDFNSIAVDKSHRNLGIGSLLINSVFKRFRNRGFKKALLEVRMTNRKAMSFYKKIGFKIKKTIKKFYKDGQGAYRMEKSLS